MDWNTLIPLGGLLTLITTLVGAFSMAARSLRTTSQAIGELSKTNIEINRENRAMAKSRHEVEKAHDDERAAWKTERVDMQCQLDGLSSKLMQVEADFASYRESSQKVIDELGQELVKVKQRLADAKQEAQKMEGSVNELTSALRAAQDRVKELETREQQLRISLAEAREQIARLERDNMAKDTALNALQARVKDLEVELRKTQDERAALEKANADLLARLAAIEAPDRTEPEAIETHDESPDVATSDKEQI